MMIMTGKSMRKAEHDLKAIITMISLASTIKYVTSHMALQ